MSDRKKQVVVIGQGLSGRTVTEELCLRPIRDAVPTAVTVIDSRNFYELDNMSAVFLRKDQKEYAKYSWSPEDVAVPGARYEVGTVTAISESKQDGYALEVATQAGKTYPADVVVVCTGFHIPVLKPHNGQSVAERVAQLETYRSAIKAAKNVLIAGSGGAGVELAGDVRLMIDIKAGATVTLICSGDLVMNDTFGEGDRRTLTNAIKAAPGMVVLNDRMEGDNVRVPSAEKKTYTLKSGKQVEADVYIPCFAEFTAGAFLSGLGAVDQSGMVMVDETTLQSKANKALFAVGCADVTRKEGTVSAFKLQNQGKSVGINVQNFLAGKPLARYSEGFSFAKHDFYTIFGHGYYGIIYTEKCGCPGLCWRLCGFPLPCCVCCCCGCNEGPCGFTCCRPAGKAQGLFFGNFAETPEKTVMGGLITATKGQPKDVAPPPQESMAVSS